MAALTAPRDTPRRLEARRTDRIAAKTVHQGGMVAVTATGSLVPAGDASAAAVIGAAIRSAQAGDTATAERGVYRFDAAADNPPRIADIGRPAYAVDDHTLARSAGVAGSLTGGYLPAGTIRDVDDLGVWVEI